MTSIFLLKILIWRLGFLQNFLKKKLQTLLWCILALGSLISSLYFSLAYFKGAVYERLFTQEILTPYVTWIPSLWLVVAVVSLIAAAQINISFFIQKRRMSFWTVIWRLFSFLPIYNEQMARNSFPSHLLLMWKKFDLTFALSVKNNFSHIQNCVLFVIVLVLDLRPVQTAL